MKSNHLRHHRRGSIIITLIGAMVFVVIFFGMYCFKQLQVNWQAAQIPAARRPYTATKNHHWPSPDSRLAFRLPADFSLGRRTFKLADQDKGRVLFESDVEGNIVRCKWRGDNKACAVEYKPIAGRNDVVLLLIEGDQVTKCRPADVIEPNRFLPDGDQQLEMQWEQTVKLGEFREDGDLLIQWVGIAKLMRPGRPDRVTRAECHFQIGYTAAGDVLLVESFPRGKPETDELPVASAAANVVIPRGIRLRPFRPKSSSQISTSSEGRRATPRTADSD